LSCIASRATNGIGFFWSIARAYRQAQGLA